MLEEITENELKIAIDTLDSYLGMLSDVNPVRKEVIKSFVSKLKNVRHKMIFDRISDQRKAENDYHTDVCELWLKLKNNEVITKQQYDKTLYKIGLGEQ